MGATIATGLSIPPQRSCHASAYSSVGPHPIRTCSFIPCSVQRSWARRRQHTMCGSDATQTVLKGYSDPSGSTRELVNTGVGSVGSTRERGLRESLGSFPDVHIRLNGDFRYYNLGPTVLPNKSKLSLFRQGILLICTTIHEAASVDHNTHNRLMKQRGTFSRPTLFDTM